MRDFNMMIELLRNAAVNDENTTQDGKRNHQLDLLSDYNLVRKLPPKPTGAIVDGVEVICPRAFRVTAKGYDFLAVIGEDEAKQVEFVNYAERVYGDPFRDVIVARGRSVKKGG